MFSPFRTPALRARRSAPSPRSSRPPESLGEIEAAVAAAIPVAPASAKPASARREATAETPAEEPEAAARFQGGGSGGFV